MKARNPEKISPENWNNDLFFLGTAQNHRIQLDYSTIIGPTSISIRSGMSIFAGTSRRCSSGGANDPIFTQDGGRAFQRDLKNAE